MWRPNDWKNPYPKYIYEHTDYEDGADAIVKAIKQKIDKLDTEAYGSQCGLCSFLWNEEGGRTTMVRNLSNMKCEKCKTALTRENVSPSEIYALCISCWLKSKEGEQAGRGFVRELKKGW